jgi:SAM-dependent methyltransferase
MASDRRSSPSISGGFFGVWLSACSAVACSQGAGDDASRAAPVASNAAAGHDAEHKEEVEVRHDEQAHKKGHGEHEGHGGHGGHHRFDDPARFAKMFDSEERIAWQKPDAVIAGLGLAEDAVIADIGAGTGTFTVRFAKALPRGKVYANDVEPAMVAHLTARAAAEGLTNVAPVLGTAEDPKLPEELDLAFVCDVFHHIEAPSSFFGQVLKRLKPEGRLVIVDFKKDAPEGSPGPPKAMRLRSEEVIAALSPLGLVVERVDETMLEFQYVIVLRRG